MDGSDIVRLDGDHQIATLLSQLAILRKENEELRERNKALEAQLNLNKASELEGQNLELKGVCAALERQVESLKRKSAIALSILDIVELIFDRTVLPPFLLDPSNALSPGSLWTQAVHQTLDLMSVCKIWRQVGSRMLYRDIHIMRPYQLPLFERSLAENVELTVYVRSITMLPRIQDIEEDEGDEEAAANILLASIVSNCPNIFAFTYYCPDMRPLRHTPYIPPPHITSLHLSGAIDMDVQADILAHTHTQLTSLTISPCAPNWEETSLAQLVPGMAFPLVTDLAVISNSINLDSVTKNFRFPLLRRLTFEYLGNPTSTGEDTFTDLATTYMEDIEYLHLSGPAFSRLGPGPAALGVTAITVCLRYARSLVHLVVCYNGARDQQIQLDDVSPTLRWVDIVRSTFNKKLSGVGLILNLPNVHFRTISTALNVPYGPLIRAIPPDSTESGSFEYFSYCARFEPGKVWLDLEDEMEHYYERWIEETEIHYSDSEELSSEEESSRVSNSSASSVTNSAAL